MRSIIWEKENITKNEKSIRDVFEKSYGKKIGPNKFRQIYKSNPFGKPNAVALKNKNNKLVGFYGLIPQKITLRKNKKINKKDYLLGTTLMVLPEYQSIEALSTIMEEVDSYLEYSEFEFLLGFPNENSFIPLSRLFGWKVLVETQFFEYDLLKEIKSKIRVKEGYNESKRSGWSVPYSNSKFIEWKKMCGNYKFACVGDKMWVVYKKYDSKRLDIVDTFGRSELENPDEYLGFLGYKENKNRAIITGHHAEKIGLDKSDLSTSGNYKIRLCTPNKDVVPDDLSFSLLMSDVF